LGIREFLVKYLAVLILILALLLAISGCSGQTTNPGGEKSIVVTYSVLGSLVKEMVGDLATVTVLIPNGLDPHEWEPSAKDIEKVNNANLVVRNGLTLEAGLERTLDAAEKNSVQMFIASDHIHIRYVGQGEGIPTNDPDQAIGAPDPHLWMDPLTVKDVVTGLSTMLNKNFGWDLTERTASLSARLDILNQSINDLLQVIPASDRKLVTGHESMGYFADRYGFKLVGVIVPSLSSKADVTAANLAELKKIVQENNVKAIFTELGTSAATAKTIANETGVKVVELNTHALPADGSYFTFLNNLAGVIISALK
jgi:zinc/manganese transport system substrate-binding protein